MAPLSTRPGWRELSAVRSGRVFLTDGSRSFNRPGPRIEHPRAKKTIQELSLGLSAHAAPQ
jgi:ABC-type Fe3+-hydroxamate transport system substrate-binding protein